MKATTIPNTDSISELSAFWDTHDLSDFDDELEDVPETVFDHPAEEAVTIRLPAEEVKAVKQMAHARGIGHTALIRKWVIERLQRV